jgi:hypothetical protein
LFDPLCPSPFDVWLEYGGTVSSGTIYCCGPTSDRSRRKSLKVEHIPIPLVDDVRFREFDGLIQRPLDRVVHATIVGRFFAGRQIHYPNGSVAWGGYGHFGCYSLLAIQQVLSVDPQDRADVDYGASPDQPDASKTECGYQTMPTGSSADFIAAQRQAETGSGWALVDPQRVASDTLARMLHVDATTVTGLRKTRESSGRVVYEWRPMGEQTNYMVVASRPYWLSFYAQDPQRVAWVVIGVYESSCK